MTPSPTAGWFNRRMSDVSVRTARPDDVDRVGEVQAAVWRSAYADVVEPEALELFVGPAFADAWRTSLAAPPSPVHRLLVATENDTDVVGFVAIGPTDDGRGEILAGGVLPSHTGRGHGSRLLNAATDTLMANDLPVVRAVVLEQHTPLVRFLAKAGFAVSGGFADRVVRSDGGTAREIELHTDLAAPDDASHHGHDHPEP